MNNIKKIIKKIGLLSLIFFILFSNFWTFIFCNDISKPDTQRNSKIKLSNEDITISNEDITINTPQNRTYTNSTPYYYQATYGFDFDNPFMDWGTTSYPDTSVHAIDEIGGHKKVVEFIDSSSSESAWMETLLSENIEEGAIEYWVRGDLVTQKFWLYLYQDEGLDSDLILFIQISDGNIDYWDGSYHTVASIAANKWYHIMFNFSTLDNTGGLYINGDEYSYNGYLNGNPDYLNRIRFATSGAESLYNTYYIDAVGFSWDPNYNIGDNLNSGLLLSFETNQPLNWMGYSLDGQSNVTIYENTYFPIPNEGLHIIRLFGTDNIGNIYKSAIRFFTMGPLSITTPENKTYTDYSGVTTGYYPATYGFENDAYKAHPAGWNEIEGSDTLVRVRDKIDGHKKVVEFRDWSPTYAAGIETTFAEQTNGTIEYWVYSNDVSKHVFFQFYQESTMILLIQISGGNIDYWDGSYHTVASSITANKWYHIKVDFSTLDNTGGLYINGDEYSYNGYLNGNPDYLNRIRFATYSSDRYYNVYIDAVGFSWDPNYNTGDNFRKNSGFLLDIEKDFNSDWIGYSLDGQLNSTILGDKAIPMPNEGGHTIQVYANKSGIIYETEIRHFHIYWNATIPDTPTNVVIVQGIEHIYLSWDIPNNNNAPIKRYNLYRGNVSGGYKKLIAFSINPYYNDTNAGKYIGHRFFYIIRAENVLGESADSEEISGKAYDGPFIDWLFPEENARVVFPYNASDPGSLWVQFDFSYESAGLDYEELFLNNINYGNVSKKDSIKFEYNTQINGSVNATLRGYKEGSFITQNSRNLTFAKIILEVVQVFDEGLNLTGEQLYLILHDPHGDHSYSGFSETTSLSMGVSTHISNIAGVYTKANFGLFGTGAGASASVEVKTSEDYDFRLETTQISAFTSNQESVNPDYIGPGNGDVYWGEVWLINWVLKGYKRIYYGETEWVNEDPLLEYGIIRDAEALLNDNYAPENWKALNPVHNNSLGVDWIGSKAFNGGIPYSFTNKSKTTETWSSSFEIVIDTAASIALFGFSTSLKFHFEYANYNNRTETKEYIVSYTIYDDEPTDFIAQQVGIDKTFGTPIFKPYSLTCNTSNPLEHNTYDYVPPVIEFPDIILDSNGDDYGPCSDDSPIVTVDLFDEGGINVALINYSINNGADWEFTFLSEQLTSPGTWEGIIPSQEFNTTVIWYIMAWDNGGHKSIRKDLVGNPFKYTIINKPSNSSIHGFLTFFTIPIILGAIAAIVIIFHKKRC